MTLIDSFLFNSLHPRSPNPTCEIEVPLVVEEKPIDPIERKRDVKDGEPELGLKKDIKFESPANLAELKPQS